MYELNHVSHTVLSDFYLVQWCFNAQNTMYSNVLLSNLTNWFSDMVTLGTRPFPCTTSDF